VSNTQTNSTQIKSLSDFDDTPAGQQTRWETELAAAKKEVSNWHDQAEKVWKKYRDDRNDVQKQQNNFNVFNVNVGILQGTLYARLPSPVVSRRFNDMDDQVARVASNILERVLETELIKDGFHQVAKKIILDRLVPGAGIGWIRYEAVEQEIPENEEGEQLTDSEDEATDDIGGYAQLPVILDELTPIDYVHWNDFFWSPDRTWDELRWIARRVYMPYDQLVKRFGEDKASQIPLQQNKEENNSKVARYIKPENNVLEQAEIFEIWDKETKKVIWVALGCLEVLDVRDDFLGLCGFFPTKHPLLANLTTQNIVPKPDYLMIQDQYQELDKVNNRISKIVDSCKVVGVHDAGQPAVRDMLANAYENELVPVKNWAAFATNGGLKGAMDFMPIDQLPPVLAELRKQRDDVIAHINQLTGISELVRGTSQQYVTATAEQLKSHYASARMVTLQQAIAEYFEGMVQLKAELICKFYDPQRILSRAGSFNAVDQQYIPAALALLKSGPINEFRIEVSVDSIQLPNQAAEQAAALDLAKELTQFFGQALPQLGNAPPALQEVAGELLRYTVSKFRNAREFEGVIDAGLQKLRADMSQPKPPPPPTPEQQKMQADIQHQQVMAQREQQEQEIRAQQEQQRLAAEMLKADKDREADLEIARMNNAVKMQELALKEQELALRARELQQNEMSTVADYNLRNKELAAKTPTDITLPQDASSLFDVLPINSMSEGMQNMIAAEKARHLTRDDIANLQDMLGHVAQIVEQHKQGLEQHANAMHEIANTPLGEAEIVVTKTDKGMVGKIK